MISIGIIFEPNSDYVYTINTVMSQSYESLEVICALYEGTGISAYDILECIRIHRRANVKRVYMISGKQQKTFAEHLEDIAKACKGEYLLCLSSKDAFYDANAINALSKMSNLSSNIICGTTVVYQNSKYAGVVSVNKMDEEEISLSTISNSIQQGASLLIQTSMLKNMVNTVNSNISLLENEFVLKSFEVPCLRHENVAIKEYRPLSNVLPTNWQQQKRYLNYTDGVYLVSLIEHIQDNSISEKRLLYEIDTLTNYIVGKQAGGYWNITISDQVLLDYLRYIRKLFNTFLPQKLYQRVGLRRVLNRVKAETRDYIKIIFLVQEYHLWPSLKSVYDAAVRDDRFSPELVHIPFKHVRKNKSAAEELSYYREAGYSIKEFNEYNLSEDSPDVVICIKPYDSIPKEFLFNNIDKVVRRSVYIRYAPIVNFVTSDQLMEILFALPAFFMMWKSLAYTQEEWKAAKQYSFCKGQDWIAVGHPRDDFTLKDLDDKDMQYYIHLQKLAAGRKIFMWNTAAQMTKKSDLTANGSFLEWGLKIIKYFANRKDIFVIWRPHPLFRKALSEVWGEEKGNQFMEQTKQYENIYIDEYKQYTPAFLLSDALISDASSLIDLYIPSLKPIMLTKQSEQMLSQYDSAFRNAVYILEEELQLYDFTEMVISGKHTKYNSQKEYAKENYFSLRSDRMVAENLLDIIAEAITTEEKESFAARKCKEGEVSVFVPYD